MIYHNNTNSLDGLDEEVAKVVAVLEKHFDRYDSIAVQGLSGVTVGLLAARELGKPLVIVRKENDGSHAGSRLVNDEYMGERVLFLDDFISSGATRSRVEESVVDHCYHRTFDGENTNRSYSRLVGTLEYCHIEGASEYDPGDDGLKWRE